jgi:hypothetical protein
MIAQKCDMNYAIIDEKNMFNTNEVDIKIEEIFESVSIS